MKISYNWLQNYVSCPLDPNDLAEKLTMVGVAAEEVEYLGGNLDKVVSGKILTKVKHPNADKLSICQVDVGDQILNIVTGATNIEVGDLVPVATNGALLPNGVKIKKSKLRGEPSEGMMCSAQELCLDIKGLPPEQQTGILLLPPETPVGQEIKNVLELDDTVITFELTANRGDCFSILGIAREVSAVTGQPLQIPQPKLEENSLKSDQLATVEVEAVDLCKRYVAKIVQGVKVGPSPLWLQRTLAKIGVRSINNIVDVTNYVMFELGQPLHAFDYDKLSGNKIIVRQARDGEEIVTLDGNKRVLNEDNLVIADQDKSVALAGVMGGENSEVTENTVNILIESANFDPISVRKTAKQFGLRSEASLRFEKGVDPNICVLAADRTAELIVQLAGGSVCQGSIDVYPEKVQPKTIDLPLEKVNGLLGTDLNLDQVKNILERLDLTVETGTDGLLVTIPTFRLDLRKPVDLIEEIARLYGYNQIQASAMQGEITQGRKNRSQQITDLTKELLIASGLNEVVTFSLGKPEDFDLLNLPADDERREVITLMNPLTEEQSILRTTLLPNILDVVARNLNRQVSQVGIFEIASAYYPKQISHDQLALEIPQLVGAITGYPSMSGEKIVVEEGGFFRLKGILENLFKRLAIRHQFISAEAAGFHPGRTAAIVSGELVLGVIGEVHPAVLENYRIAKRVCAFELNFANIIAKANIERFYKQLPKFPSITRDLAVVVDDEVSSSELVDLITRTGGELLEKVSFFDLYRGANIAQGARSLAYSLVYRAKDRTLTDEEINTVHSQIVDQLKAQYGVQLR